MQQQATQNAQNFYGQSIGSLKSQIQNYRSQLEQFSQQVSDGDAQAQIQEMIDSYMELEGSMDQAAQDMGVEDTMEQAAQQTMQQIQQSAQGAAQGAAQQAQDMAGQATGQAQQAAGQVTDQAGQVAQQGQQAAQQAGGGQQQQPDATQAAEHKAQELGVDLSQVQGSGAGGRITVRDVIRASNQ